MKSLCTLPFKKTPENAIQMKPQESVICITTSDNISCLKPPLFVCVCVCVCVCVLAVCNKAQVQRISNREFKLWTFLQGTESRVATFLAETCVSRQTKTKSESPTAVEFGSRTPKSDHDSSENG